MLDSIEKTFEKSPRLDNGTGYYAELLNSVKNVDSYYRSYSITNPDPTGSAKIKPVFF